MKPAFQHPWEVSTAEARSIQNDLRNKVTLHRGQFQLTSVAGVDISVKGGLARAAVVVLRYPELTIMEWVVAEQAVSFPYVPGLLTFREAPSILKACEKLTNEPDLFMFDGQGIAHPRRFGLASHLGVLLDRPSVGCAKSRYIGTFDEPYQEASYYTDLWDGDELIGAVLRTRTHVKPVFVSPGHRMDIQSAIDCVLECCAGYRLPEPTRLAHHIAGGNLGVIEQARFE